MDGDYSVVDDYAELNAELESTECMLKVDQSRLRNAMRMETFLRDELREEIETTKQAPIKELYGTSQLHAHFEDVIDSAIALIDSKTDFPEVEVVKELAMDAAMQLIEEFLALKLSNPIPEKVVEKAQKFLKLKK